MSMEITLKMTDQFFDRQAIQESVRRAGRDWKRLEKAGAFVRRRARTSMRKVKKRHRYSQPGRPPRSHAPDEFNLRKILYIWDPFSQSMIVGPVGGGRKMGRFTVPELHEYGGSVPASSLSLWDKRYLQILRREAKQKAPRRRNKPGRDKRGRFTKSRSRKATSKQAIAFVRKIEKGEIQDRDEEITGSLQYPERPYMRPALQKEMRKFPELWEGSVVP